MRSRLHSCLAVVLLAAGVVPLHAQTPATVTLTASHLLQGDGVTPDPVGYQVSVLTTDASDNPIGYRVGASGGQTSGFPSEAVYVTLTSPGVMPTMQVLNSAATAPANACLRISVWNLTGIEVDRLTCVQTGTTAALATWCSISGSTETCDLDEYQPPAVPATIVPAPASTAGAFGVSGALTVGGNATFSGNASVAGTAAFGGAVTFAGGQTFPGTAPATGSTTYATIASLAGYAPASGSTVYATSASLATYAPLTGGTFTGPITAPTGYLGNHGWLAPNLLSATHTAAQADCGALDVPGGDIAVTVTLPAPSSLSSMCALHFSGSLTHTLTLSSGSANISSPAGTFMSTYTVPAGTDAEVLDIGTGWFVLGQLSFSNFLATANTWTQLQTFSGGVTSSAGVFAVEILGSATPSTSPWSGVSATLTLNGPCIGTSCPSIYPVFPGLTVFGDSGATGFSQAYSQTLTYPYYSANGYAWLLAQDLGGVFQLYPYVQDTAADLVREHLLPVLTSTATPTDQRNPTTVLEDGGNDAKQCQTYPVCTNQFKLEKMTEIAWAGIPLSQKIVGQASIVSKSGTWTSDNFASLGNYAGVGGTPTAQPAITGIAVVTATLTGSPQLAIPITTTASNQGVYCSWRAFYAGSAASGAARFGVDSATATTDTWSAALQYATLNGTADTVFTQQYIVATAGAHTLYVTPTAVPFSFVACAAMPQTLYQAGEPKVLVSGVWHELTGGSYSGVSDTNTGNYDTAIQQVVTAAAADNIAVAFGDVRSHVAANTTDLSADGVHPTIVGYQHVRDGLAVGLMNLLHLTRF